MFKVKVTTLICNVFLISVTHEFINIVLTIIQMRKRTKMTK